MTGGTSEAVTAYSYGGSEFIPCFKSGSFCLIFSFLCIVSKQPENCENRNDPDLVQAFLKKWWVESDFKVEPVSSDTPKNRDVGIFRFYFSYQKYCGTINCCRIHRMLENSGVGMHKFHKFSMTGQEKCDLLVQVTSR
jgi:hypothetical protein